MEISNQQNTRFIKCEFQRKMLLGLYIMEYGQWWIELSVRKQNRPSTTILVLLEDNTVLKQSAISAMQGLYSFNVIFNLIYKI